MKNIFSAPPSLMHTSKKIIHLCKKPALAGMSASIIASTTLHNPSWADPGDTTSTHNTSPHTIAYNRPPFDLNKPLPFNKRMIPVPADPTPAPYFNTKRRSYCRTWKMEGKIAEQRFASFMQLNQLHKIARGRGQTIAVIDTGVTPNGRYHNLINGGDYISHEGGLNDCSGHGSLVAGLIGATRSRHDNFVGVAPDATIIAIKAVPDSLYEYDTERRIPEEELRKHPLGGITELAHAITHAANLGATVINISLAQCTGLINPPDTKELRDALLYAVQIKHIVVVAAAGNSDDSGGEKGCKPNPGFDPSHPADIRNWSGIIDLSLPSYFQPLVLSVGSTNNKAIPLTTSLTGPWVDVAAPGYQITSFNRDREKGSPLFVNAAFDPETQKTTPISGTSFAAPLVAGLAALIKERYPDLSPLQIINRIETTAHHPDGGQNNFVGYGVIDAKAALTANVPTNVPFSPPGLPDFILPPPPPPSPKDTTARTIALYICAGSGISIVIVGVSLFLRRKKI